MDGKKITEMEVVQIGGLRSDVFAFLCSHILLYPEFPLQSLPLSQNISTNGTAKSFEVMPKYTNPLAWGTVPLVSLSHPAVCKIIRRQYPLKNFPSACIITRAEYAKVTHQFSRLQYPLINHIVTVDSMTINTILIGRFTLTQIECFHYI